MKNVGERLKVGGPVTSKNAWIPAFLDYCDAHELPVDFVSTHQYPTDSFGKPGDDTKAQLAASHRDALQDEVKIARDQARGHALFYTEWNSSSNPRDDLHDQPYAAAFDAKTVLGMHGLVEAYSTRRQTKLVFHTANETRAIAFNRNGRARMFERGFFLLTFG